ncbi:ABC transporter ATP-binding protein [Nostoc sp. DedQUE09]|uniref:ABC transporter ATP-binding protein n=1 Tax=Nostoc sp. DedQUE09 TaxID=3075394 RepID=UPI002AD3F336|nr:ABC transporter ATP-binding protein [Nostoc sp. DedQUE09]MDZ7949483.1 ABC transporter ATP-binding protein [Nostoc sp. DedQUE09]
MLKYLSKFFFVLGEDKKKFVLLILVFTSASILEAIGISFIAPFLWLASNSSSLHQSPLLNWIYITLNFSSKDYFIVFCGLALISFFCLKSLLYFQAQSYINRFSFTSYGRLISRLLRAYLSVPYTFYLSRDTAGLIKNIILETQNFCYMSMLPILESTSNSISIIILLLLLAKTDILLLVIIFSIILPTFLLFYQLRSKARKWGQEESEAYHNMIRTINHSLGGIKETYMIGCQPYFINYMDMQAKQHLVAKSKFSNLGILPRIILETLLVVFLVLIILVYQIFLKENSQNLISVLSIFAVASIRLMPAMSQTLAAIGQLQKGSYALDMLYSDLKNVSSYKIKSDRPYQMLSGNLQTPAQLIQEPMSFTESIELKNVSYSYPNSDNLAIEKISLTIKRGESVAFIGKSGSGKTTLVDVILGLLEATKGEILVDGISICKNIRAWQNIIGYIPQSVFLVDDTIEKNIAFGVPENEINYEKLKRAIHSAQLAELIEQLPDGVKTAVGERGIRLSGGQRQRICIARVLYHERDILVLDEATAALDTETESQVTDAINALAGEKTIIIIAHRLSTIKNCDRIYLMNQGYIIKSGSSNEVLTEESVLT